MKSIVNIKDKPTPTYTLYMGRANKWLNLEESKWRNPFPMKAEKERPKCIFDFTKYFLASPLLNNLHELTNEIGGCYCVPRVCHVHIIKIAYDHGSENLRAMFEPFLENENVEGWFNFVKEQLCLAA